MEVLDFFFCESEVLDFHSIIVDSVTYVREDLDPTSSSKKKSQGGTSNLT
jgi:hypothetical protein